MTIVTFAKKYFPDMHLDTIRYHMKQQEELLKKKDAITVTTPMKTKKVVIINEELTRDILIGLSDE